MLLGLDLRRSDGLRRGQMIDDDTHSMMGKAKVLCLRRGLGLKKSFFALYY